MSRGATVVNMSRESPEEKSVGPGPEILKPNECPRGNWLSEKVTRSNQSREKASSLDSIVYRDFIVVVWDLEKRGDSCKMFAEKGFGWQVGDLACGALRSKICLTSGNRALGSISLNCVDNHWWIIAYQVSQSNSNSTNQIV